jgi:hypothetical protein
MVILKAPNKPPTKRVVHMQKQIPTQTYVICVMYERGFIFPKKFVEKREVTLPPGYFLAGVAMIMGSDGKVIVSLTSFLSPSSEEKPDDRRVGDQHFDNIRFDWVTSVNVLVKWEPVGSTAAEEIT